ncbi:probable receptor-like protein kinase At2g23200 [Macadamia integrifolia]|uniref:probable receptor-like protein kinase At2g23200 n=1 Tax=Macadamia integrifolia TaxID=60698 RepID=UPI001C4F6441|nr:probable receptor-like protein kinase At2g23200 [Macadamia integrifolia]
MNVKIQKKIHVVGSTVSIFQGVTTALAPLGNHGDVKKDGTGCIPMVDHVHLLDNIPRVLHQADCYRMDSLPGNDEIRRAVWELDPDSSPGLDGFSSAFFRRCWLTVEVEVCNAVRQFFSTSSMPHEVNNNFLVLIPKVEGANTLDRFRPLCLENERWIIDNGNLANFWKDKWWGPKPVLEKLQITDLPSLSFNAKVGDFIRDGKWALPELHHLIHRDIKSTNKLLHDNYTAKVSEFGASSLVSLDHTQISTLVQGTWGYLDPEYLRSSQLIEKSDVYSFGEVLVELLTEKKALYFDGSGRETNLAMHFVSSVKEEDRVWDILDDQIVAEGFREEVQAILELEERCLRLKGEERPTMKEVAMEL